MECKFCGGKCNKRGLRKGIQSYQCKECKRYQQASYKRKRILEEKYEWVYNLTREGNSICGIARLLYISKSSVQRIIERIAAAIKKREYQEEHQTYEMDELRTFCGKKDNETWVCYIINKTTGKVIACCVGRRTKENLKKVIDSVLCLQPKKIYTDGLNIYKSLIPEKIHKVFEHCTNKIERNNLTLRTHLKRLSRKTICFTRSNKMLENCVKLYFA